MRAKFSEVFEDVTRKGRKLPTSQYNESGKYPIFDQGQKRIAGYTDEEEGLYTDVPAYIFGDHTRIIKYIDTPCFLGADGVKLLKAKDETIDSHFLYYALLSVDIPNTGYNRHFKWLKEATIKIVDAEEQQNIVKHLEKIEHLIALQEEQLAKLDELVKARFVEMFGDPEINPCNWSTKPLADVITNANNGMARRGKDENGSIVLRLVELQDGYIDYTAPNRIVLSDAEKRRYLLRDKDFLFARVNGNPDYVGRCAVFHDIGEPVYHNDHIIRVHFDEEVVNGSFACALFNSTYGKRQMLGQIKTSAGQYTISQDGISSIIAILPPLELQNQFAAFVQATDQSKSTIQASIDRLETLKQSLMQEYYG